MQATYADRVPGEAKPDWSHVYLSQQHLDPSKASLAMVE